MKKIILKNKKTSIYQLVIKYMLTMKIFFFFYLYWMNIHKTYMLY